MEHSPPANQAVPRQRPCTCGGSNSNCRHCFGLGYIVGPPAPAAPVAHRPRRAGGGAPLRVPPRPGAPSGPARAAPKPSMPGAGNPGGRGIRTTGTTSPRAPADKPPGRALARCPRCAVLVRADRLPRHLGKAHRARSPAAAVGARGKRLRGRDARFGGPSAVPRGAIRDPSSRASRTAIARLEGRDELDHTRGYAHAYRESGRFGSHPSHDGFDDESEA